MGRAARAKAERRAAIKSEAWRTGNPTIVQLRQETYAQLQTAIEDTVKVEALIAQIRDKTTALRADAMRAAGLDPSRTYRLNAAALTAELVE